MRVMMHSPSIMDPPVGMWWVDQLTGTPTSFYVDPESSHAVRGAVTVHMKDNPDVSWEQWFESLADRMPIYASWDLYDIPDDQDPRVGFKALRAQISNEIRREKKARG